MKGKYILILLSVFITIILLSACNSEFNNQNAVSDNNEKSETVSEYDKIMQDAEEKLNSDDLEEAKNLYREAREKDDKNELGTKIDNLETFIPLVDDALFDYLITVDNKEYQVLIHAEDYNHETASIDDSTAWACAEEGEEVYEGDYSIFARERSQTKFTELYLGDSFINKDRDPLQTVDYNDGELLALAECQDSSGSEIELFSILDEEVEQVTFNIDGEEHDSIISSYNMIKSYNPKENKFQSITYNKMEDKHTVHNYTYNSDTNEMDFEESLEVDDIEESIDEWTDQKNDFHFEEENQDNKDEVQETMDQAIDYIEEEEYKKAKELVDDHDLSEYMTQEEGKEFAALSDQIKSQVPSLSAKEIKSGEHDGEYVKIGGSVTDVYDVRELEGFRLKIAEDAQKPSDDEWRTFQGEIDVLFEENFDIEEIEGISNRDDVYFYGNVRGEVDMTDRYGQEYTTGVVNLEEIDEVIEYE